MSFEIHVGLLGMSGREAREVAASVSQGRRLHATYDPRVHLLGGATVAISESAGGMLSDDADWNADYWELRPQYLEPLSDLVKACFADSREGIAFRARWTGDEDSIRGVIMIAELVALILTNRVPNKVVFVVKKPVRYELRIQANGPRPACASVAEHLWGAGVDFDSDGNSTTPDDGEWTELTLESRTLPRERVDIDPIGGTPLVLKVVSSSKSVTQRVAEFIRAATNGKFVEFDRPRTEIDG